MGRKKDAIVGVVKEIELVGPNIAEVARRVNAPKESVSYTFRAKILKKGYSVHARPDRGALGLRQAVAVVDIAAEFAQSVEHVFDGMDNYWFLHDFVRTLPDGKLKLCFAIPEEHYGELARLLRRMVKLGLISKVHYTLDVSWRRFHPMRAEHFDFKRGRWEFDWAQPSSYALAPIPPKTPKQKFDSTDVRMLAYLESDATLSTKDIAKRMGTSSKTAYRHAQHISERHLIEGYRIGWIKTQMDPDLGRPNAPLHKLAFVIVHVLDVTEAEQARLSEKLNRLHFIFGEGGGRDYYVELGVPLEQLVETTSYLREVLEPVSKRSHFYIADPTYARTYSAPLFLVDDSTGGWVFDIDEQTTRLAEQMEIVRKESRTREQKQSPAQEARSS